MPDIVAPPRVNESVSTGSLNDAIEYLEKILADGIGRLKAAFDEDQAVVAGEAQLAEQVIEGLNAKITLLETMLTESEETLQRKDIASQETEDRLNTEIRDLQNAVSQKQEALDSRDSEVNDLKSKRDILAEQLTQLELAIQQAKDDSASQAQQAEQVIKGLKTEVTGLAAKLKETEDSLHKQNLASQETADSLNSNITDLQNRVRQKQEDLDSRDAEISDLKSTSDILAEHVARLESVVQQAKEEAASQVQQSEQVIEGLDAKITALEVKLTDTEGAFHKKDVASQETEDRLNTEIRDLQNAVSQKQEALDSRDSEINDLKSKRDILAEQTAQLELAIQQAKDDSASQAQQAEQVIEGLKTEVTGLEAKLKESEDALQRKDLAIQEKADSLNAGITDLQNQVRQNQEALNSRNAEINELKSTRDILAEQVAQLEAVIQQTKEEAASQAQQSDQVVEGLHAKITALEAKRKETEDTLQRTDLAVHEHEDSLNAEIRDLKSVATQKQEALDRLDTEVNDLKSKRDNLAEQLAQLEFSIQQAKQEAASQGQQAEQVIDGLKTKIAMLEAQLAETEQFVGRADTTIEGATENRDAQIIDLNTELEPQTTEIKEMYSFFTESEPWIVSPAQDIGTMVATEPLEISGDKPVTSHVQAEEATSVVAEPPKFVSREFLDRMIVDFSQFTNVIGTIASLIVRDHVRALGESMEEFPQTRLTELVESLGGEIFDYKLRAEFHERYGKI